MNKEAYVQGWHDALASLSIGVANTTGVCTVCVMSKDKVGDVVTVLASASVYSDQDIYITL